MLRYGQWLALVALLLAFLAALPPASSAPVPSTSLGECVGDLSFEAHDPIVLAGDAAALASAALGTNGVRSGTGTPDDPLVISDWDVQTAGGVAAIHISRVSLHLIIQNMILTGNAQSPAVVIEESANVTLNTLQVHGDVHITDSMIDATSLNLVGGRFRTLGGTITAADTYVHPAAEDGAYTWTFIASTFDISVARADDCADADRAFFAINVLGTTPQPLNSLTIENVYNTYVSITKRANTDLNLNVNTTIDALQATGAVVIEGLAGPTKMRNATIGSYTAQDDGATATITSAVLGYLSFLDTEYVSLSAIDSILDPPGFGVSVQGELEIRCERSDVLVPDRINFHLAIEAADCFVDDPSGKAIITPAEGRRAEPHFHDVDATTEHSTPHPSIVGLLVLVFIMASTSRRKGRRGRVSIQR